MRRFWEIIISAEGSNRFYCFPFICLFWCITPLYQLLSRYNLKKRKSRCSRDWNSKLISIGSIMVGGSGKTPLTIWLARRFIDSGKKVVVLHSGYGRKIDDKDIIIGYNQTGQYSLNQIGDETAMMIGEIPEAGFAIGSDKKKMLIKADQKLSPDIIIIDDGFQRLDIEKDIDIAVIDQSTLSNFKNGLNESNQRLFPSGKLREPLSALKRADSLFVIGTNSSSDFSPQNELSEKRTVYWRAEILGVICDGKVLPLDILKEHKPFLFAGLGSYDRLLTMLESNGIELAGEYNFGDHHDYDKSDIEHLKDMARIKGAKADCYLTTAKDMVKLSDMKFDLPVYCLVFSVEPHDMSALDDVLEIVK